MRSPSSSSLPTVGRLVAARQAWCKAVALALVGAACAVALPVRAAFPQSAEGSRVAVATDHADATRAALATMDTGGNAVDGAIAAALTLGVVNPVSSGLGGGGFALVYTARDHKITALDFREMAPVHMR